MNENEILKQIDELINNTDQNFNFCTDESDFIFQLENFYVKIQTIMKNYEKILETEHFKQTEI